MNLTKEFLNGGYKGYTELKYFYAINEQEEKLWNHGFRNWLILEKGIFEKIDFWEEYQKGEKL